jgi:uncharacterized protein (DUF486 family)
MALGFQVFLHFAWFVAFLTFNRLGRLVLVCAGFALMERHLQAEASFRCE